KNSVFEFVGIDDFECILKYKGIEIPDPGYVDYEDQSYFDIHDDPLKFLDFDAADLPPGWTINFGYRPKRLENTMHAFEIERLPDFIAMNFCMYFRIDHWKTPRFPLSK